MIGVLMLGYDDVIAALSPEDCERAMAEVLVAQARGEAFMPLRSVMAAPGSGGLMGLMPAWGSAGGDASRDRVFCVKAICIMPGNPARGLDAHQGIVTLFDGETGRPQAILDASAVTEVRTAAVTAVATRALARQDASVLAILGAGVQASSHLRALAPVRGFSSVRVYAPNAAHVRSVLDGAAVSDGVTLTASDSAEDAVRGADVVVSATNSREPVLRRAWLKPGAHVNAIGASTPAARELDVETVAASALFCDSRESLRSEAGEYQLALAEGAIAGESHVRATLGEVLAGTAGGRTGPGELTLFRSLGLAVEDLAAAARAVAAARRLGIGTEVAL